MLFRHLRHAPAATRPVLVHLAYHSDAAPRMEALLQKYNAPHDSAPLMALPLADTTAAAADVHSLQCDPASREGGAARLRAEAGRRVVDDSPWAWGGVTGLVFGADGAPSAPTQPRRDSTTRGAPNSDPHPNQLRARTPTLSIPLAH